MDETIIYLAAFVVLIAVAVAAAIITVRREGRNAGDIIKQLLIWVAVAALLPLTSYAGATMLHPLTKMNDLVAQRQRVQQETYDTKDTSARDKSRDKAESLRKQIDDEQRAFYRSMFWVGFPIGCVAFIVGFFLPTLSVGIGLAFGGLCTLAEGCYSYWNDMGDSLRFYSLLVLLITIVVIGLIKYRRPAIALSPL